MSPDPDERLSAQVALSEPAAAPAVVEFFSDAGFETGPVVGISFAISGPRDRFEAALGAKSANLAATKQRVELPLDALPGEVASAVDAIAVAGPPDFGLDAG